MNRTRVKICGITSVEDALSASELGADAIGLVFYARSRRCVSAARAAEIVRALPAFVSAVGLFVDAERGEVEAVLEQVHLDCLQFHGSEGLAFCESFGRPYMKAVRVADSMSAIQITEKRREYSSASAILLDAFEAGVAGGTGRTFDWTKARECSAGSGAPIVLAGGLGPDNVATAISELIPWAVDVSSGVEKQPGQKDPTKMKAFFEQVRQVEEVGNGRS